jgi:hypothetical protein
MAWTLASTGCAPEVVPSSGPRSPTSAEQVKIYQKQPRKYEKLGTVTVLAGSRVLWDDKGEAVVGFDELKAKAAALGANGLLLTADPSAFDAYINAGYHGTFYQVPVRHNPKSAIAQAIFVLEQ